MGQPATVQVAGVVSAGTTTPSVLGLPALAEVVNLALTATYSSLKGGAISIASPVTPVPIPFEGIVAGRFFALRLDSGPTVQVSATFAGSGLAVIPVSDELVLHSPRVGDELVSLELVGTADLRYVLAGDVA